MKSRRSIAAVYGPVLLAALLILTAAPACAMPSCDLGGNGVVSECGQTSRFKSACDLEGSPIDDGSGQCGGGSCDDAIMSHGNPDGTVAESLSVPSAFAVAQAPRIPVLASIGVSRAPAALPEPHPPDPLGVRLTV